MYEITGLDKNTLTFVIVAVATCYAEVKRILDEEAENYWNLTTKKIRCGR